MAEIINLRQARKRKARADAERMAAENRAKFGQTRAQKQALSAEAHRLSSAVDGARREKEEDDTPPLT
jgi:hypothetical protein